VSSFDFADPFDALRAWSATALDREGDGARVAFLATASPAGRPFARSVVIDALGPPGLTFGLHRGERSAMELDANPHAALCFHWRDLRRQVRAEGAVEALPAAEGGDPRGAETTASGAPQWSGYRLIPERFEFWINMPARLHLRHEFRRGDQGWSLRMLYP
jgi:pyridoxamine 5'-phosphate oxidase